MTRLKNKITLVIGAARGIGQAIAELFTQESSIVIITDINDHLGQQVADSIGINAEYYHLDVSQESEWQKISHYIQQKYGYLDILINNAGITGFLETKGLHDPEHFDLESWHKVHSCLDPIDHKLYKFGKLYRARQVLRSLMTDRNTIDEHS